MKKPASKAAKAKKGAKPAAKFKKVKEKELKSLKGGPMIHNGGGGADGVYCPKPGNENQ